LFAGSASTSSDAGWFSGGDPASSIRIEDFKKAKPTLSGHWGTLECLFFALDDFIHPLKLRGTGRARSCVRLVGNPSLGIVSGSLANQLQIYYVRRRAKTKTVSITIWEGARS
jgi:hypothetical protein